MSARGSAAAGALVWSAVALGAAGYLLSAARVARDDAAREESTARARARLLARVLRSRPAGLGPSHRDELTEREGRVRLRLGLEWEKIGGRWRLQSWDEEIE